MATIERRYECCGYAYTKRTRMGFSPKFTVTRDDRDKASSDIVIWAALGHPAPKQADLGEIVHELAKLYPDRRLLADTDSQLVPVFEPAREPRGPTAEEAASVAKLIGHPPENAPIA